MGTSADKKKHSLVYFAVLVTLLGIFIFIFRQNLVPDFHYFSVDCSIYNKSGKILFYTKGQLCAFADDGKVAVSEPNSNSFSMIDAEGSTLWTAFENVHHDLKFTTDQTALLAITGEVIDYNGRPVRSDCFSKRDLKNAILAEWCLSNNINELEKLGFTIRIQLGDAFAINPLIYATEEISHANSIYEIPDSPLSERHPAFREGNYLVDLHSPIYALLILDRNLKTILWSKSLENRPYGIQQLSFSAHDSQVTPDGKILSFVNYYKTYEPKLPINDTNQKRAVPRRAFNWGSSLVEFDPLLDSINWIYEADPPEKFRSPILGSVTELKNGNYLFSDITARLPVITEVNLERKTVWKFEIPDHGNAGTFRIRKVKPMYDLGFLKARNLIN